MVWEEDGDQGLKRNRIKEVLYIKKFNLTFKPYVCQFRKILVRKFFPVQRTLVKISFFNFIYSYLLRLYLYFILFVDIRPRRVISR